MEQLTDASALTAAQQREAVAALERFVVDNEDLLALELHIGKFNIFDAVKIARTEIRHSNFLAFIIDPAESHGHGQLFLNALLMDLLKTAPPDRRPLSPIDLDGTDLRDVEVRRELGHIDLLIASSDPPFVVAIENKVGSSEHSDQLNRYEQFVAEHYPQARPLFVYLTPNGVEASTEKWVSYSYRDIYQVFKRVRDTYRHAIGEDVRSFLNHYLTLIGSRFMGQDQELDQLCQRIYKNHRQALDLLFERFGSPAAGVLAEAEAVLREDSRWHVFYRSGIYIDFVPTTWLSWLPPVGLDHKDDGRAWFVLRMECYKGKLDFYVEIRRMSDLAKRREIVQKLIDEGSKFGFKHRGGVIKDNYTRVSGRERILQWDEDDDEPAHEVIGAAVKKKLDDVFPKIAGVPTTLRELIGGLAPSQA